MDVHQARQLVSANLERWYVPSAPREREQTEFAALVSAIAESVDNGEMSESDAQEVLQAALAADLDRRFATLLQQGLVGTWERWLGDAMRLRRE